MEREYNQPAKVWGLARISLGLVFLWAFLDKLFGFGYSTCASEAIRCDSAWIEGGSPTTGFLTFATDGPLAGFYQSLAGIAWVDWLFMIGLFGIGLALILGIGIKIATTSGVLMLIMLYFADWPPSNNPLVDEHVIYVILLVGLYKTSAQDSLGAGKWWRNSVLVKKFGFLE